MTGKSPCRSVPNTILAREAQYPAIDGRLETLTLGLQKHADFPCQNDHIWSGSKHGKSLQTNITSFKNCALRDFVATPIDEMGTVDVTFTTGVLCGKSDIESALWETMKQRLVVLCKKMRR